MQEAAGPSPMRLAEEMPQYGDVWDKIVAAHNLRPLSLDTLVLPPLNAPQSRHQLWYVFAPAMKTSFGPMYAL